MDLEKLTASLGAAEIRVLLESAATLPPQLRSTLNIDSRGLSSILSNPFVTVYALCENVEHGDDTLDGLRMAIDAVPTYGQGLENAINAHNAAAQTPEERVADVAGLVERLSAVPAVRTLDNKIAEIKMFAAQHNQDLGDYLDEFKRLVREALDVIRGQEEMEKIRAILGMKGPAKF